MLSLSIFQRGDARKVNALSEEVPEVVLTVPGSATEDWYEVKTWWLKLSRPPSVRSNVGVKC